MHKIVLAVTGASGSIYPKQIIEKLRKARRYRLQSVLLQALRRHRSRPLAEEEGYRVPTDEGPGEGEPGSDRGTNWTGKLTRPIQPAANRNGTPR